MADVTERLRVVIEADGTASLADGTRLSTEEVRKLGEQLDRTGGSSERTGRQMASLGREIVQGDWPGAAANMGTMAMRAGAVEAAATGMGSALGVAGAAAIALGAAIYAAREETERQADALLLTGNYAGLVGGQLNQMARETAAGMNGAVGNTRQTMEALVSTGRVTTQSLGEMAKGVELVSRFSGQSREAVTKDFAGMADGVANWAAKHNQSYHFITYEQYKYIEALEKAGQTQEAMRVTSEALNQHLGGDMTRNLGILERGWTGIGRAASWAWDKMLNIGRDQTAKERVDAAAKALAEAEEWLRAGARVAKVGGGSSQDGVERARAELDAAQEVARLERRAADEKSRRAQEEEARIAADREKKKQQDDGDSTYQRLELQLQRRLALAQAEEEQNGRLSASERYRLQGLQQIADVEAKIGPQRADVLRALVSETAEVLRNSEAREDLRKTRERTAALAEKEITTQERELAAMQASNHRLEEQIQQVGLTTMALARLKAERLDNAIAEERMNLVMAQNIEGNDAQVRLIERRIALLERQRALTEELGNAQDDEETRRQAAAENKKYAEELRRDLTGALQHAFAEGKDPLEAFGAAVENTIKVRATRGLAEALLNPILRPIEDGSFNLSDLLGGGGGGEQSIPIDGYHTGGMVGAEATFTRSVSPSAWRVAPRFHTGGITGDEVPILAKRGEGVFTPGQMKALGAGLGGGGMTVNLNVVNNGAPVNVRQQTRNGGMDIDVILDPIEAGLADRVGSGSGPLARSMEGRYGLRAQVN